jgi:hypothetical protein
MLEGQPPLAAGEEAAWAALAAELRELAASARARPRSFAWETIPGELYPFSSCRGGRRKLQLRWE